MAFKFLMFFLFLFNSNYFFHDFFHDYFPIIFRSFSRLFFSFCGEALTPWSARTISPISALIVREAGRKTGGTFVSPTSEGSWVSPTRLSAFDEREQVKFLSEYDGDALTVEDKRWLGTNMDLSCARNLPCKPEWIVLPFRDTGMQVGPRSMDFIGTKGSNRLALGIEKCHGFENNSDVDVISDIYGDIQDCLTSLRRREILRSARVHALQQCTLHLRYRSFFSTLRLSRVIYLMSFSCSSSSYHFPFSFHHFLFRFLFPSLSPLSSLSFPFVFPLSFLSTPLFFLLNPSLIPLLSLSYPSLSK